MLMRATASRPLRAPTFALLARRALALRFASSVALLLAALLLALLSACAPDGGGDGAPAVAVSAPAPPALAPADAVSPAEAEPPAEAAPGEALPSQEVSWDDSGPMTGAWHGAWVLYGHAAEGEVRARLRHFDESFNGTIELSTPDALPLCGKTSGTIVWGLQFDDYVTFGFYDVWSYGMTFHGTLRGRTLSGEFLAITECGAQSGTFRLAL